MLQEPIHLWLRRNRKSFVYTLALRFTSEPR